MPTRHTHSLSVLFLFEFFDCLLLENSQLAESKLNLVGSQLSVGVCHSTKSSFDCISIEWIKENSFSSLSVDSDTGLTACNAAWLNNVIQKCVVHSLKGARTWSLLRGVMNS